jgi:hypothetical protein
VKPSGKNVGKAPSKGALLSVVHGACKLTGRMLPAFGEQEIDFDLMQSPVIVISVAKYYEIGHNHVIVVF